MITFLFISLAAIFKAVSDTCADHFYISIFKNKKKAFWDKATSSDFAKRIFGYKLDAWHISNTLMICSFMALLFAPINHWYWYLIYGVLFNVVFNIFYNHVLRS